MQTYSEYTVISYELQQVGFLFVKRYEWLDLYLLPVESILCPRFKDIHVHRSRKIYTNILAARKFLSVFRYSQIYYKASAKCIHTIS